MIPFISFLQGAKTNKLEDIGNILSDPIDNDLLRAEEKSLISPYSDMEVKLGIKDKGFFYVRINDSDITQEWHNIWPLEKRRNHPNQDDPRKDTRLEKVFCVGINTGIWFDNVADMMEYQAEINLFVQKYRKLLHDEFNFYFYEYEESYNYYWKRYLLIFREYNQLYNIFSDIFVDCYLRWNGRWRYWQKKMRSDTGPFRKWQTGEEPMYLGAWRQDSKDLNEIIVISKENICGCMDIGFTKEDESLLNIFFSACPDINAFYEKHNV